MKKDWLIVTCDIIKGWERETNVLQEKRDSIKKELDELNLEIKTAKKLIEELKSKEGVSNDR